jgi:hypothetical protein
LKENILGPPLDRFDALSDQALERFFIHPNAQPRFDHVDILDRSPQQMRPQAAANGFDFGKFRHGKKF